MYSHWWLSNKIFWWFLVRIVCPVLTERRLQAFSCIGCSLKSDSDCQFLWKSDQSEGLPFPMNLLKCTCWHYSLVSFLTVFWRSMFSFQVSWGSLQGTTLWTTMSSRALFWKCSRMNCRWRRANARFGVFWSNSSWKKRDLFRISRWWSAFFVGFIKFKGREITVSVLNSMNLLRVLSLFKITIEIRISKFYQPFLFYFQAPVKNLTKVSWPPPSWALSWPISGHGAWLNTRNSLTWQVNHSQYKSFKGIAADKKMF